MVVQLLSCVWLFASWWTAACQAPLSFTISQNLLKLMSVESVTPSNHLILCRPLLLPSVFPSIRVFSSELAFCIRWPKYWSFSFSTCPSSEYSGLELAGLITCPRDSQESSPAPQCESINSLVLSALVQLSHPYMTTEKTIALTRRTFLGKEMALLFIFIFIYLFFYFNLFFIFYFYLFIFSLFFF